MEGLLATLRELDELAKQRGFAEDWITQPENAP
jgi:hypothetical protein